MINEKIVFLQIVDNAGVVSDAKLFMKFNLIEYEMVLITVTASNVYSASGMDYVDCLENLLKILPHDSKLIFGNKVTGRDKRNTIRLLEVQEHVYLECNEITQERTVEFLLQYVDNEKGTVQAASKDSDFSIALQQLFDLLEIELHSCAFCQYSDFKSNGGEDLRHGWYCFRELNVPHLESPWYEREKEFDLAIANVDVFYWCPNFKFKAKRLT